MYQRKIFFLLVVIMFYNDESILAALYTFRSIHENQKHVRDSLLPSDTALRSLVIIVNKVIKFA